MKSLKYILGTFAAVAVMGFSSCTGDLDVTPIDPNMNTSDKALTSASDYLSFLAQLYTGFATSGSYGPDGDCNISGIDGGMSQYMRGLYHLNELTTDESVCGWNDQTLQDLHNMCWTTEDVFIEAMYARIFYQISMCNEFLRQANATSVEVPDMEEYKAEARALRLYCWLHAIDMFGNVPFADETSSVGSEMADQMSRSELFNYIVEEAEDLLSSSSALAEPKQNQYGRADKGLVKMILAKLYLNAEVYTGVAHYDDCAEVLLDLTSDGYSLHSDYQELFLADNNNCTDEIIFAIEQDGIYIQSYGCTNYLIFASTGGEMDPAAVGISSGWGGLRMTPEFYDLFESGDERALFYTETQQRDVDDITDFTNGYAFMKFKNINSDGTQGQASGFVDTDWPVYRYADVLLMLAECAYRGASNITADQGRAYLNEVRARAGLSALSSSEFTADNILDERACELYQECFRRQDLIRFNKFTTSDYLWQWKGGVKNGTSVSSKYELFPIPNSELMSNSKLSQNSGY